MADLTIKEIEDHLRYLEMAANDENFGIHSATGDLCRSSIEVIRQLLNERTWRPIAEMPSRKSAFIFFRNTLGKGRIVKAMYAKKFEIEQDACDAEFCDYNEEADKYYWPEGWYEDVYAETGLDYSYHHMGDIQPTHFMPLPEEPTSE